MFKTKLSEEARYGLFFACGLLLLLILMALISKVLGDGKESSFAGKEKEKTVVLTQPKRDGTPPAPLSKSVVSSVREAITQGNHSTAFMEIRKIPKGSPEYEELNKLIAEETRKRKAPGLRRDAGVSSSAPVRYLDESTPRDRTAEAVYLYFIDISGSLMPRFCIQTVAKRLQGITGFTIAADNRTITINAPSIQRENTEKGVAEWYDVPLDRRTYETVHTMIRAKKVTLTISGSSGKTTRSVTDNEKKGFRQILDGYAALGGNLDYLQAGGPEPDASTAKRPSAHRRHEEKRK